MSSGAFFRAKEEIYTMLKLLSLFTGIGAFEKALERLQINYELVGLQLKVIAQFIMYQKQKI